MSKYQSRRSKPRARKPKSRLPGYPKSWLPIYRRKYPSGQQGYYVDFGQVKGKRKLRSTLDIKEAEAWSEQGGITMKNEGIAGFSLSRVEKAQAEAAMKQLEPHGVTIQHAVDHYMKTVLAFRDAPPISEIVKMMVTAAASNNRRDRTVGELRSRLGMFAERFGTRQLSSITLEELEDYIDQPEHGPYTRINNRTKISQMYNFALRKQWVSANLTERLEKITPDESEISFFSVEQCVKLLEHANDFDMMPYTVIGLFAGLRNSEVNLIDWSALKLSERVIRIAGRVAKKRSRGVVTLNETLAEWIAPYMKAGKVIPFSESECEKRWRDLRIKAGITENPKNGLRHSFATFHYAMYNDIAKTCYEMREKNPIVLLNHYSGLASQADARRFWSLRPGSAENVVAMKAG